MWLKSSTPVADRVFRTTRRTLLGYRRTGVLDPATVIPERTISDEALALDGPARRVYDAIDDYVRHTYAKYKRVLGKQRAVPVGWIMAIYRRRLTSSFHAVRCSLERRREALDAAISGRGGSGAGGGGAGVGVGLSGEGMFDEDDEHGAGDADIADIPESLADAAAAAEASSVRKVMAEEVAELNQILGGLDQLTELADREPKMAELRDLIQEAVEAGHTKLVVFTQYADTLRFIRDALEGWRDVMVCYYGGRGEHWDDRLDGWGRIGKEQVKDRFREPGAISVMVGTDSMSEGLNLQASDWLVNFDLPWNFTRVEQRIGRVDRIGGRPEVQVTNLMYADTIEERIFRRITECHRRFGDVLGPAAPVLSDHLIADCVLGEREEGEVLDEFEADIERLATAPLRPDALDRVPHYAEALNPAMTLDGLRDRLFGIGAARSRFGEHPDGLPGAWLLELADDRHPVTFDPSRYDSAAGLSLLTWGNPLLSRLLAELEADE